MEGRRTRGRQKIEIKRIEKEDDRLSTFSKRRGGIYKKASELATLCGAEVGVVVFSPTGKPFSFGTPSVDSVVNRFLTNQQHPAGDEGDYDRISHPIMEAHWQARIIELNEMNNALSEQLDAKKDRVKTLQQIASHDRGSDQQQGWWEAPLEKLDPEGLKQTHASFENLVNDMCAHLRITSKEE